MESQSQSRMILIFIVALIVVGVAAFMLGRGTAPSQPPAGGEGTVTVTETVTETITAAVGEAALPEEIPIGLAIAVSGGYAVDGPRRLNGAMLAIKEMNALLERIGAPFRFVPVHEDTKASPEEAVNVINRFIAQGIKVVVGPLSTSETAAVMPIVNREGVVVISPSSTGQAAAYPDDFVFRAPPPDTRQGPALAQIIYSLGYNKLVIIARNDDYGRGLAELVEDTLTRLGGQVETILYDPNKPDLTAEVQTLAVRVQEFGADESTAVLIIAFDTDGLQILEKASKIEVLGKVRWFGPDALGRKTFVEREDIAEFLKNVNFLGTKPAIARNPVTEQFEKAYREEYGEDPTPYAYYAYDAAWLAMLSVLAAGKYDGEAIRQALPMVAFHFIGATGHKILDENGDAAVADYTLFAVVQTPEGFAFQDVGVWRSATEQIVWFEGQGP